MAALSGLAKLLVDNNVLPESTVLNYIKEASQKKHSLIQHLLQHGSINKTELALYISRASGYPFLDLKEFQTSESLDLEKSAFVKEYQAYPLSIRDKTLFVAVSDPTEPDLAKNIALKSRLSVQMVISSADEIKSRIDKLESSSSSKTLSLNDSADSSNMLGDMAASTEPVEAQSDEKNALDAQVDEAPVVRFIHKLLLQAIQQGASDLHFEPYEKFYRVRFRIDGVLKEIATPPLSVREVISARIKVISRLDISEKRLPQDGRTRIQVTDDRAIDFRVSILPTVSGEKIVMRILDPSSATLGIEALGYSPTQKKNLLDAVHRPYGMVLVTGPTGSGKTVSLYTCLNILNTEGTNISTAEDPAEISLPGVNQVNVNDKIGLTFAAALRSFLRQDPDIIMVGEIRDLETAQISIKAAQTGHMVLSTLHTNDAPSTLTRLINMGIPGYNIASTVNLITAQRLGRRLCKACKKPTKTPREKLLTIGFKEEDFAEEWVEYGPGGCDICNQSGYKGRVGIYQVMPISEAIEELILKNATNLEIARQAKAEGVDDLRRSGLLKVKEGLTSVEEVLEKTNE